mmetsp:Transcript_36420/g.57101  ORF Transcript_36420/g.57101 Transcript_36420/m.57101 type:complete len:494 (-) Transcript_36420:89-1570(-)
MEEMEGIFQGVEYRQVGARYVCQLLFNEYLSSCLPFLDLSQTQKFPKSLAAQVAGVRNVICTYYKKRFWLREMEATVQPSRQMADHYDDPPTILQIPVDRAKAMKYQNTRDGTSKDTLFYQLYERLASLPATTLRQEFKGMMDKGQKRCFRLEFKGEGVTDNGGPYREVFGHVVDELQSATSLLRPCPNFTEKSGQNRELWVVNWEKKSVSDLDLFAFLGQILGLAQRAEVVVGWLLEPLFWKGLVGEEGGKADIEAVDVRTVEAWEMLLKQTKENYEAVEVVWDSTMSGVREEGGGVKELKKGGKDIEVKYEELEEFVKESIKYRIGVTKQQMKQVRRGLGSVAPIHALRLFSWEEAQELFCGEAFISVAKLRDNTFYKNVQQTDSHITYFWRVLERMNQEQLQKFLRFTGSRSRLPSLSTGWSMPFRIVQPVKQGARETPDEYLPTAQTCFFKLELPKYSSQKIMEKNLLKCLDCISMDTDENVSDNSNWV